MPATFRLIPRFALILATMTFTLSVSAGEKAAVVPLADIKPNHWVKLHEQSPKDEVRFRRQEHGGSCFDTKRGRLVLFGSNTHGSDWTNSPLIFDLASRQWSHLYPNDDKSTYKANAEGLPVAGVKGDHPWAMHTFGTVIYDPQRDEMVVCCWPAHMVPGRFTNALKDVWGTVKRHPTWTFDFAKQLWTPLPCEAVHFFPNAAAWDSDRNVIIGYGGPGIWELGGATRSWKKVGGPALCGWHNNAVYDPRSKALVVFGSNENSNDIIVYRPATGEHRKMPTPGTRPPKDQHNPMCFDPGVGRVVVVVDIVPADAPPADRRAETWLYDTERDQWQMVATATLPFACGMNYNMHYDPNNKVCLLVADEARPNGRTVAIYALRLTK